jgi:hypothetical protein
MDGLCLNKDLTQQSFGFFFQIQNVARISSSVRSGCGL